MIRLKRSFCAAASTTMIIFFTKITPLFASKRTFRFSTSCPTPNPCRTQGRLSLVTFLVTLLRVFVNLLSALCIMVFHRSTAIYFFTLAGLSVIFHVFTCASSALVSVPVSRPPASTKFRYRHHCFTYTTPFLLSDNRPTSIDFLLKVACFALISIAIFFRFIFVKIVDAFFLPTNPTNFFVKHKTLLFRSAHMPYTICIGGRYPSIAPQGVSSTAAAFVYNCCNFTI